MPITISCQTTYASSNHSGLCNADANRAGRVLPVDVAPGSEVAPDAEGEEEEARTPEPDDPDPPTDEPLPPAVKPLPDAFEREVPPRQDEEEENDEPESDEPESDEPEKPVSESGAAGVARESTNTSPRMCSTNWAGTPGGLTGWVNTMCTPVAVTVSSPELP
ncbi:MAG TPA: hypothetical protein VGH92_06900, partial [Gaiellaceae bacterium]